MTMKWNLDHEGTAVGGFDVVAYHERNQAVRGSRAHQVRHGSATFWFSSDEHMRMFRESPETYLPKYGGFCAFAVAAKGVTAPSDPRTFKIRNGELLLFYNDFHEGEPLNTSVLWNKDEISFAAAADENWARISD